MIRFEKQKAQPKSNKAELLIYNIGQFSTVNTLICFYNFSFGNQHAAIGYSKEINPLF